MLSVFTSQVPIKKRYNGAYREKEDFPSGVSQAVTFSILYNTHYMFNRIVGLDVGRNSAVLCCLDKFPDNVEQHFKQLRKEKKFYKVNCDRAGVDKLLSLNPTAIVLEPTGHWYMGFG